MEFSDELGQFFIFGECIQRAEPFKSFRLKGDIRSIQIIGHEAAKGAIAAVPGKDGLSRAAAGAVLGFLVAGPLGTVVGASAGAAAPKGKAGRDATEERFTLLVEFVNESPKIQTAYVSRGELSQLAPYLSEPKKVEKKEIEFDVNLHVNPKNGIIYSGCEIYAEKFNRKRIEKILNSNLSSLITLQELIDYIKSPGKRFAEDNSLKRIEKLYLALRYRGESERSKKEIRYSIFDYSQPCEEFFYYKTGGAYAKMTDEFESISNRIYDILNKNISSKNLDEVLSLHISPQISKNPRRFPTDLAIVNVAAIAPGSFFEQGLFDFGSAWSLESSVLPRAFTLDELKLESARLRNLVGPDKFDKFLCRSVSSLHIASHEMLDKIMKKEVLSTSDIGRALQCCVSLCFMADRDEVAYAENTAKAVLIKAQIGKRTKKTDTTINSLQTFIECSKGEFSEKLGIYRLGLKKKAYSAPEQIEQIVEKEAKSANKKVTQSKTSINENSNNLWSKVKNIFR
jgi:hypothetical protein